MGCEDGPKPLTAEALERFMDDSPGLADPRYLDENGIPLSDERITARDHAIKAFESGELHPDEEVVLDHAA